MSAVAVTAAEAHAAIRGKARKETLSCVLMLPAAKPRSGAPITAEVRFDRQGTTLPLRLVEGRLHITFRAEGDLLATYRSAPLPLAAGEQCFRMLLPAVNAGGYSDQVQARMRFVTRDRAFRLGSHTVFVPTGGERSLAVCISRPRQVPRPRLLAIVDSLKLERYDAVGRETKGAGRRAGAPSPRAGRALSTFPVYLAAGDLPASSLSYCSYDTVILVEEGLALLRRRQLEAIARWAEAGGSVFVMPGGGLKGYHVEFLNRLAGTTALERSFFLDSAGAARRLSGESEGDITAHYSGLGRTVIVTGPVDTDRDLGTPEWRRAAGFLWKVRAGQMAHVVKEGRWRTDQEKGGRGQRLPRDRRFREYYGTKAQGQLDMQPAPVQIGAELFKALVPKAIRIIPLWLIVLILVLFVAAIGPGDYFILGGLRRRRLTWVTFPALCICFALFTMLLSEWYMGRRDYRNLITFVDVGAGGRVLRRSRYEMIFTARHMAVATQTESGLFSALDHRRFGGAPGRRDRYGRRASVSDHDIPPPVYAGRIPVRFTAHQQVRQWTPQLNRTFTLEPGEKETVASFDWDSVRHAALEDRDTEALIRDLGGLGRDTFGYLVVGYNVRPFHQERGRPLDIDIIRHTSVRPQTGFFSVVSQISPNGGADFEDLSLLDPTDPKQRLLVIVTKKGDDFVVYRRLYHGE